GRSMTITTRSSENISSARSAVIMVCDIRLSIPKKKVKAIVTAAPPNSTSQITLGTAPSAAFNRERRASGHVIELAENFRDQSAIALVVDHREHAVDGVERLLGGSTYVDGSLVHSGPVVRDRGPDIASDGFAQVGAIIVAEPLRQPIKVLRGARFADHIGFRVAEFLPHHDNHKSEQHRV